LKSEKTAARVTANLPPVELARDKGIAKNDKAIKGFRLREFASIV